MSVFLFGPLRHLDERVNPCLHMVAGVLKGGEVEPGRERYDQINLRAVADLGEAFSVNDRLILFQIKRSDAVNVIVGDLEQVVRLAKFRRVNPIEHAQSDLLYGTWPVVLLAPDRRL